MGYVGDREFYLTIQKILNNDEPITQFVLNTKVFHTLDELETLLVALSKRPELKELDLQYLLSFPDLSIFKTYHAKVFEFLKNHHIKTIKFLTHSIHGASMIPNLLKLDLPDLDTLKIQGPITGAYKLVELIEISQLIHLKDNLTTLELSFGSVNPLSSPEIFKYILADENEKFMTEILGSDYEKYRKGDKMMEESDLLIFFEYFFVSISKNKSIKRLCVNSSHFPTHGLDIHEILKKQLKSTISKMNLESLDLSGQWNRHLTNSDLVEILSHHENLEHIGLRICFDETLGGLLDVLRSKKKLKTINIRHNASIDRSSTEAKDQFIWKLLKFLEEHPLLLETLHLSFANTKMENQELVCEYLMRSIMNCKKLKHLLLPNFPKMTTSKLGYIYARLPFIEGFELNGDQLNDNSPCDEVFHFLKFQKHVGKIFIDTQMNQELFSSFCECLAQNQSVRELIMENGSLHDWNSSMISQFVNVFKTNRSLKNVTLDGGFYRDKGRTNSLTPNDFKIILEGIQDVIHENYSLEKIEMSSLWGISGTKYSERKREIPPLLEFQLKQNEIFGRPKCWGRVSWAWMMSEIFFNFA